VTPPVVYLSNNSCGKSQSIASSFEQFLFEWEGLCYIGPEHWLLFQFLNPTTGFLDSSLPKSVKLREAFESVLA